MLGRAIAVVAVAALALPAVANGATYTVDLGTDAAGTCNPDPDAGTCTLRQAISAANASAEADVIQLTQNVTFTLVGSGENNNATGDLDVDGLNGGNLTIRSNLPGTQRTISAALLDRVLSGVGGNLTLEDVRVTAGMTPAGDPFGGGIQFVAFNPGETLRLDTVTVDNNLASSAGVTGGGGGVHASGAIVQVVDGSLIDDNQVGGTANNAAGQGGGIDVSSGDISLTITDSTISDNEASAGPHTGMLGRGGGIHFQPTNNVSATPSQLVIINATISGNRAGGLGSDGSGHNGGGIHVNDSFSLAVPVVTIDSTSITGNFVGGGSGNAQGTGGGIGTLFDGGFFGAVNAVDISGNRAGGNDGTADGIGQGQGAGISTELPVTITNSTLNANRAGVATAGNVSGAGGAGSFGGSGAVTISNSTFDQNLAGSGNGGGGSHGGALLVNTSGPLSISGSSVTGNVARTFGGGLSRFRSPAMGGDDAIERSTIANNQGIQAAGGIDVTTAGTMRVERSTISGNSTTALFARGGGIALDGTGGAGTLNLINSTVSGNTSGDAVNSGIGGGIAVGFASAADLFVQESTIAANNALGGTGAGGNVHARNNGTVVSFRSSIIADGVGGSGQNCLFTNMAAPATVGGSVEDMNQCGLNVAMGDLINTDPLLLPLADNGGPTMTRALPPNSPAVDLSAVCTGAAIDQRGFTRPFPMGGACDAGSYELQDMDGDGVRDTGDNCPTQPGPASNAGCPQQVVNPPVTAPPAAPTITPTVTPKKKCKKGRKLKKGRCVKKKRKP